MKIGLNLYSIRNLIQTKQDLTNTLKRLKKVGCDFVQFSGSPVSLNDAYLASKKAKMPILLTHCPYERIMNDLVTLTKEHKNMHCAYLGLGGLDQKIYHNEKALKENVKKLEKVAQYLQKQKMLFFYHNHHCDFIKLANGETFYDYFIKQAPHIHFTFDIYWAQYAGVDVIETINRLKGRVECFHLKDYRINQNFTPEFAPLGDGNMNLKQIIQAAKKAGCKYFYIEQDNAATKKDGFNDIIRSIKYIKENF